jgi:hypothetical protein
VSHQTRYAYGDFLLWREGIGHVEEDVRGDLQVHPGADRTEALVVPASPNFNLQVVVKTLGFPNPASKDQKGWRSTMAALRKGLRARSERADPLVWIEHDLPTRVLSAVAPNLKITGGHGFVNGDVVLIRRLGVGLYSLGTVAVVDADEFNVTSLAGALHAIAVNDDVYLVEQYWYPMVYQRVAPAEPQQKGDWWGKELVYTFLGPGTSTYERTSSSTVGN